MEGNGPTGCMVIPEYYGLIQNLKQKEKRISRSHQLHPMFSKMIEKLENYLEEALECETLKIATALHPFYRIKIFETFFEDHTSKIEKLLEKRFVERQSVLNQNGAKEVQFYGGRENSDDNEDIFSVLENKRSIQGIDELVMYKRHQDCPPNPKKEGSPSLLIWWKVSTTTFFIILELFN